MRQISEDPLNGTVTYVMDDGRWVTFDAHALREYGLEKMLASAGIKAPLGWVDVMWHGRRAGTVPATFEPRAVKSTSFWYQPRNGDFVRDGDKWIASDTLGPGDLEAVPGFIWARDDREADVDAADGATLLSVPKDREPG